MLPSSYRYKCMCFYNSINLWWGRNCEGRFQSGTSYGVYVYRVPYSSISTPHHIPFLSFFCIFYKMYTKITILQLFIPNYNARKYSGTEIFFNKYMSYFNAINTIFEWSQCISFNNHFPAIKNIHVLICMIPLKVFQWMSLVQHP